MKCFTHKLTGKKARLFAAGCCHYSQAAEDACNDDPADYPLFSWLSPHQRIALVAQVAVGLLCPNEPLPPQTIQHYAAYSGVIACIKIQLEVEMDDIYDRDVGEDFLEEFYEKNPPECRSRTEEEREQLSASIALIGRAAEKNKKKLDRKAEADEEVEFTAEERSAGDLIQSSVSSLIKTMSDIFEGGPCTEEDRRPPRPLTESENNYGFRWRLLCDTAFQEDKHTMVMPPLAMVNFCWKSYDLNKWYRAVNLLMITKMEIDFTPTEQALLYGCIDDCTYADPSQQGRIRAVEKKVKELRASYDQHWEAEKLAADQRIISAVCALEMYCSAPHYAFVNAFRVKSRAKGFDVTDTDKYQERYDIYRSIQDDFNDGLGKAFYTWEVIGEVKTPAEFKHEDSLLFGGCANPSCFIVHMHPDSDRKLPSEEDLRYCSMCRVVQYCSRECQKRDWPTHKKLCKTLAASRKDKEKLKEALKQF
jgi:hypothetical protein